MQGIFDWPQEGIDPLKVLGMSLEDLDPIRRDCKVYVLFSRNFSVQPHVTKDNLYQGATSSWP